MIETDRLILRPFREGDAADVLEYLKEPMVNCFACMKVHSLEETRKAVMERRRPSSIICFIRRAPDGYFDKIKKK